MKFNQIFQFLLFDFCEDTKFVCESLFLIILFETLIRLRLLFLLFLFESKIGGFESILLMLKVVIIEFFSKGLLYLSSSSDLTNKPGSHGL